MNRMTKQILTILAAVCALSGPSLAVADNIATRIMGAESPASIQEGDWLVMMFGGINKAKPHGIHNEVAYGIRGGYALRRQWWITTSLGRSDFGPGEQTLLDVNVSHGFRAGKRIAIALSGGIGYAALTDTPGQGDSFTMNIGMGPVIGINKRMMIRILNRYRYFEDRSEDKVDQEFTIGLVVKLGK